MERVTTFILGGVKELGVFMKKTTSLLFLATIIYLLALLALLITPSASFEEYQEKPIHGLFMAGFNLNENVMAIEISPNPEELGVYIKEYIYFGKFLRVPETRLGGIILALWDGWLGMAIMPFLAVALFAVILSEKETGRDFGVCAAMATGSFAIFCIWLGVEFIVNLIGLI